MLHKDITFFFFCKLKYMLCFVNSFCTCAFAPIAQNARWPCGTADLDTAGCWLLMASGIADGNTYGFVVGKLVKIFTCWKCEAMLTKQKLTFLPFIPLWVKETERKLKQSTNKQKNLREIGFYMSKPKDLVLNMIVKIKRFCRLTNSYL